MFTQIASINRLIAMLWQNVEHFIVRSDLAKTGTVTDLNNLDGKKFSIGKKNSGTENSGRQIMKGLKVDPDKFNLAYMGYGGSASALQNGTIDGMNTPAGVPVGAVTQAFAALGAAVIDAEIVRGRGHHEVGRLGGKRAHPLHAIAVVQTHIGGIGHDRNKAGSGLQRFRVGAVSAARIIRSRPPRTRRLANLNDLKMFTTKLLRARGFRPKEKRLTVETIVLNG